MKTGAGFPTFLHALLFSGAALFCNLATANLFFSEYIEGSGNNKALEIYNAGTEAADLTAYEVQMFFNGSSAAGVTLSLRGRIEPGEVYVLAHSSAHPDIIAVSHQTSGGGWFNGDDAVALLHEGAMVDVIGQIGVDPGSQWGNGDTATANRTLRRRPDTTQGDANGHDAFDPSQEWQGYPQDTFTGLGRHPSDEQPCSGTSCEPPLPVGACGDPASGIHALQGPGFESPLAGSRQTIEAVVVGDFTGPERLNGFFVMEEEVDRDSDPRTSEGLFIYAPDLAIQVRVGDRVRISGSVSEYFGMTQLTATGVEICTSGVPMEPVPLIFPADAAGLERLEGMLVIVDQPLTVTENYNLGRYGELVLSSGGRLFNPTQMARPGEQARAVEEQNGRRRILLDDGSSRQNPSTIPYPAPGLTATNTVRSGDQVQGLEGVVHYAFDEYRIQPTRQPTFVPENPRRTSPDLPRAGSLRVASFNVLNYFNGDGTGGGFPTSRGATTPEEFQRQRVKIIEALAAMDADIVGLIELENDGYGARSAIADLVAGLADIGIEYRYVDPGMPLLGSDEITVGFIYKPATVAPVGEAAVLDQAVDPRFNDDRNRPVLAQAFQQTANGGIFTAVVTHLKSKGSDCDDLGDPDIGDGQGNCNLTRTAAARAMADWLETDPADSGDGDVLILGDLNAYAMEDPIAVFENRGYTNLLLAHQGSEAYSYVYMGLAGYLDHALANQSLAPQVTGAAAWHINADEPPVLDYNVEYKTDAQVEELYASDPYRSSDHDPLVIELNLTADNPIPGDFDRNGQVDTRDLALLIKQLRHPVTPATEAMDLNQDDKIDARDIREWTRIFTESKRAGRQQPIRPSLAADER